LYLCFSKFLEWILSLLCAFHCYIKLWSSSQSCLT
jgi:hypothetical protein